MSHLSAAYDVNGQLQVTWTSPPDLLELVHLGIPTFVTSIGQQAVGLQLKDPLVQLLFAVDNLGDQVTIYVGFIHNL